MTRKVHRKPKAMTIKEFYDWAKANDCENYPMKIQENESCCLCLHDFYIEDKYLGKMVVINNKDHTVEIFPPD